MTRADSLRALAAGYARRGLVDRARCCHEVLSVLGLATKDEEAFLEAHPSQELKPDDPYAAAVDEQDRSDHLALPEATLMAEIFSCLWEGAPGLIGQRLEDFGVSARDKVSPMSDLDLGKIYGQVAKALGNRKTALYVRAGRAAPATVTIVVQAPPALVVGPALAGGRARRPRSASSSAAASSCRGPSTSWPRACGPSSSRRCSPACCAPSTRATRAGAPATGDAAAEQAAKLKKNVPYKVSKQLVELFGALGTTSWSSLRWRAVVHHVGNRTGLRAVRRPQDRRRHRRQGERRVHERRPADAGGRARSSPPATSRCASCLRFAVSEDYFLLREKVGTAIAKIAPREELSRGDIAAELRAVPRSQRTSQGPRG